MNLIQNAKYDLNDRVAMIVQEVNDYLKECERRAREMLGIDNDNSNKEVTTK